MYNSDVLFFRIQAQMFELNLQLSESEEKSRGVGISKTTHKNESGKEIVVNRSPDGKFASKSGNLTSQNFEKSLPPEIKSAADNAIREELKKIDAETKTRLFANATNSPSIAEGIKNTSIKRITKGNKDAFSNAFNFMRSQMDLAVKIVSGHEKELAIGAAAVACVAATSILTLASGIAVRSLVADTVVELVAGKGLGEAAKTALTQLSVARVKAGLKKPIIVVFLSFKIGKKIVEEIQKQVNNSPDRPSATEK